MDWIYIPSQQATAITDFILAILGVYFIGVLNRDGREFPVKTRIWRWGLGFLSLAAFLGFVAHGFELTTETSGNIWEIIYLALGQMIAFFVVGVVYDSWGSAAARRFAPVMILIGLIVYGVAVVISGSFLIIVFYEAVAFLFVVVVYFILARRGSLGGAWWMFAGILVNLIGAAVQAAEAVTFTYIWLFDYNSAFNFIQMFGAWLLVEGLRRSFRQQKLAAP